MISLSALSKWFAGGIRILDHVNIELKKGEFLYVVGGSGAGKTTLLRLIATEEPPSDGYVSLFGYNLSRVSGATLMAIRRSIGYVPQDVRLIPDLSVYDNIAMSLSLAGRHSLGADAKMRINGLLEKLGIASRRNEPAQSLSGGEAQRVAFARALVRSPEIIIADEPTGAQDRDYTWTLMDLLLKANATGVTVVVATHDREIVRRVRRKCALLKDGRLAMEEALCIY
ncbi:MAG: hypothetical protein A2583_16115 [Bdellovibrionales bacterium RIFOXYD1_FULL_53_11]|nr:MAG: hypothetical protein A2583_16115 [Bdellovibrionales bacterium RIFOXYD1_FULL_53_11]